MTVDSESERGYNITSREHDAPRAYKENSRESDMVSTKAIHRHSTIDARRPSEVRMDIQSVLDTPFEQRRSFATVPKVLEDSDEPIIADRRSSLPASDISRPDATIPDAVDLKSADVVGQEEETESQVQPPTTDRSLLSIFRRGSLGSARRDSQTSRPSSESAQSDRKIRRRSELRTSKLGSWRIWQPDSRADDSGARIAEVPLDTCDPSEFAIPRNKPALTTKPGLDITGSPQSSTGERRPSADRRISLLERLKRRISTFDPSPLRRPDTPLPDIKSITRVEDDMTTLWPGVSR